jgi:hypothetical protein
MAKASAAVVVGYAALGVSLAAGAALCCGIARADGCVGAYLNALDDNGVPYTSTTHCARLDDIS